MSNSDQVLEYNARGANFVAVMNTFQTSPIGILWHANDATVHTLADLSNHTLIYTFGATYEKYLIGRYHYANFKTRNDDFTSRAFAADPTAVQQCFVTSEPYLFTKQGLKVKYALIYDTGFRPYGSVIFTTRQFATAHPDVVRKFVAASVRGWYSYLKDPSATNAYLLTAPGAKNYFETPEEQTFSFTQMKRLHLVDGGDAAAHGIGWFNVDRWKTLRAQMSSVGIKVGGVDVNQAFTDQFLPATHPSA
jgi:NitT/TauT family transport system substrate-binding protein